MNDLFGIADTAFDWLSSLNPWLICLLTAAFMALETTALVGLVIPGDSIVLLAGTTVDSPGGYVAVVLAVTTGAMLGESGGYLLGRLVGPKLRYGRLGRRLGEERWARAEAYLARRGAPALIPIRFVAIIHAIAPLVAGTVRMPFRRFFWWSTLGTVSWSMIYVGVGLGIGASYREYGAIVAIAAVLVASLTLGLFPLVQRLGRRRSSSSDPIGQPIPLPQPRAGHTRQRTVAPFALTLTPRAIADLADTLTTDRPTPPEGGAR